jgi:hypothetical protein
MKRTAQEDRTHALTFQFQEELDETSTLLEIESSHGAGDALPGDVL